MGTARRTREVVLAAAAVAGAALARRAYLGWGSTPEERLAALAGDELVLHPDIVATRAVSIDAPAGEVWPWIAQLGQARGGFYSYDVLENLLGCEMRSAGEIHPEWQAVAAGDPFKLHPEVALVVAGVQPGRALVVHGGVPMGNAPPPYDFSWAFVLRDGPDATTRLVVRERYGFTRWWSGALVEPLQLISFIMSRRMLHGIRERAGRTAGERRR